MSRIAWIAGGTGLTGKACLRLLINNPAYDSVIALVRRPLEVEHSKLRTAGFEKMSDLPQPDAVFCTLGTTIRKAGSQEAFRKVDHDLPLEIAAKAREKGARCFTVVTSVDASSASRNFYLMVKGELEDDLRRTGFDALHIFRPSFLIGPRTEARAAERIGIGVARALQFILAGPLRKYRPVHAADVARAMIAAALDPQPGVFIHEYDDIQRYAGKV